MNTSQTRAVRFAALPALLVTWLCAPLPSQAVTFNADPDLLRFEALRQRSDAAAVVRIEKVSYRWMGTRLVTDYSCQVLERGFGVDVGDKITLTQPGGQWQSIGQKVLGLESFAANDQLAVLLTTQGYLGGGRGITGLMLGAFRVADPTDAADHSTLVPLLPIDSPLRDALAAPVTVGEFVQRVQR